MAATNNLKAAGSATIAGAKTTHYTGDFTLADSLKVLSAAQRASIEAAMKKLQAASGGAATNALAAKQHVDLWLDGASIVRQMKLTSKLPSGGVIPAGAGYSMTYRLSDFGTPLKLTTPAAKDTFKVTPEAIQKLTSGFGALGAIS